MKDRSDPREEWIRSRAVQVSNRRKVDPYIPDFLNRILLRFSVGTRVNYGYAGQIVEDLGACAAAPGMPETL
jgi:hypothetical protein